MKFHKASNKQKVQQVKEYYENQEKKSEHMPSYETIMLSILESKTLDAAAKKMEISTSCLSNYLKKYNENINHEYRCKKCRKKISYNATYCKKCARNNRKDFKVNWPPTKELIKMLESESYRALARKLGVSDNAIRKRIKNHPV